MTYPFVISSLTSIFSCDKAIKGVKGGSIVEVKIVCTIIVLFLLVGSLSCNPINQQAESENAVYVILLHGLARTNRSMVKLEKTLSSHGYNVINVDYPSTEHPIEFLADKILSDVVEQYRKRPQSKIHFVTHSLGGIIVRYYLKHHVLSNLGRVVMLSPPNQGSELVDHLRDNFVFKEINGPAGQQLGTDKDSIPLNLGPVDFELGVITGNMSLNPVSSVILPGPDDGTVSVAGAKVDGMSDFLVLPHSHTFIMQSEDVIDQVIYFLEHGKFSHVVPSAYEADLF